MPVFVNPETGQKYNNDRPDAGELAAKWGLVPQEEYDKQHALDQAGEGTGLQSLGEGIERGVGAMAAGIQHVTGFGTAPGLADNEQGEQLPGGGLGALQNAYTPEAEQRREAHPILSGIGQGIGMAPAAAAAGALGAAAVPAEIPLVGGAIGGVLGESAAAATQQEYDDSWFQHRPMEAANVAGYTLMFAGGDLLFRGALKGTAALGKRLLFGAEPPATSLGGRNLISEAQGAARDAADVAPKGGGGSVGAASASDLVEPFDNAIRTMSDKDAAVLARDANDHLHLVSQDASEAMTRVNQGLSDNLGSQLKYEDFATNAQHWDAPLLERQSKWLDEITSKGDDVARQLTAADTQAAGPRTPQGQKPATRALDFGNLGAKAANIIDTFNTRIAEETDPARRNYLTDSVKKQLDGLTNSIDASFNVDQVTRSDLKAIIGPYREELRQGLMNPKYWGKNAEMQQALNGPWTRLLEHWTKVQQTLLEATGHTQFDTMGAGRITKESTVDRMRALFGKDPRSNQEMGRHLAGALDGLQGLIEARQAHGIANTDGLEAMAGDVRNLMEDWNLATTVGVAENRVANLKRDPRKWANLALDLGERLPLVGKPIHMARSLGDAFTDLHLEKGSALGHLWDQGYRRFAQNPALQDPSISANYADWILDALRQRGGDVPVPPAGNMGAPMGAAANEVGGGFGQAAQPAAAEPGMHWTQTAPAESVDDYLRRQRGEAPAQPAAGGGSGSLFDRPSPGNPNPSSGGSPAYQRAMQILRRRRTQAGNLVIDLPERPLVQADDDPQARALGMLGERIAKFAPFKGNNTSDTLAKMLKSKAPISVDAIADMGRDAKLVDGWRWEHGPAPEMTELRSAIDQAEQALPEGASQADRVKARDTALRQILSDATGIKTRAKKALSLEVDASKRYPKAKREFNAWTRQALDEDAQQTLKTWQSNSYRIINGFVRSGPEAADQAATRLVGEDWIKPSEATSLVQDAPNLAARLQDSLNKAIDAGYAVPGRVRRGLNMSEEEVDKLLRADQVTNQGFMSTTTHQSTPKQFAARRVNQEGGLPVVLELEQKTGVPVGHGEGELLIRPGTTFDVVDASRTGDAVHVLLREAAPSPYKPEDLRRGIQVDTAAKIGGALAVVGTGLAARNAQAAQEAQQPDRPPPPAPAPLPAYSGALREINRAGDAQIQALASSVLRKRDPGQGGKTPLDLFGGRRSLQDSVEAVRQRLEQIAGDPGALVKTLSGSVGDLWKTHPTVYDALVQRATQIADYLHAALPPRTATTLMDPVGGPVSFDRAWDFAAKFVGAVQPKAALREVTRGTAPPEMIDALQTNHPELWDGLRAHVLGQVQRLADAGRHIPSEKLARLDRELGMDGQLDPSMSLMVASHFLAAQDAEAQKRQQAGQSGKMPPSSGGSSFRTPLDAINSERANAS